MIVPKINFFLVQIVQCIFRFIYLIINQLECVIFVWESMYNLILRFVTIELFID